MCIMPAEGPAITKHDSPWSSILASSKDMDRCLDSAYLPLSVPESCLALQGILSKYKVSDADYEAIMKWKHDV